MFVRLSLIFVLLGLIVGSGTVSAQTCKPNDVVTSISEPVYVSHFVISLNISDCPDNSAALSNNVVLQHNQFVQFWFRLQGSEQYLKSGRAVQPFVIRFFRRSGNSYVPFDAVQVAGVNMTRATGEAQANNGRFDWRIWVRKKVFFKPGEYSVAVYQAGKEICFKDTAGAQACTQNFKVQ